MKINEIKCPKCSSSNVMAYDHDPLSFHEQPIDCQVYFKMQCQENGCSQTFDAVGTITHLLSLDEANNTKQEETTGQPNTWENETSLRHRLAMVMDDIAELREFIRANQLQELFYNTPTRTCESAITHINNIEIACDLTSDESMDWKLYSK